MNSQDELERMLGQQLHHRVDGMTDAPLGLGDVKGRAGRIRRNRRIAAGAAVAAAVAIVVPTALLVAPGTNNTTDLPVAPSDPVQRDIRTTLAFDGLATGDAPAIEYFTEDGVVLPGSGLQRLDQSYQALIEDPAAGGWMAVGPIRDELIDLTADFERTSARTITESVVTNPDRSLVAFVAPESGAQTLVVRSTTDPEGGQVWNLNDYQLAQPVAFLAEDRLVFEWIDPQGRTQLGVAEPDGETTVFADNYLNAVDAHPETGLVSVQTKSNDDGSGCFGVVDTHEMGGALRWETCDYSLGTFSPDGQYVLASDPYQSGFGKTSVTILDADTGSMVATFQPERGSQIALPQVAWESSTTVLATAQEGPDFGVVRFGTDGTLEAAIEPTQPEDPFGDLPIYFGMDRARF